MLTRAMLTKAELEAVLHSEQVLSRIWGKAILCGSFCRGPEGNLVYGPLNGPRLKKAKKNQEAV